MLAHQSRCLGVAVGATSQTNLSSVRSNDVHDVALFKVAFNGSDAHHKQTHRSAAHQRLGSLGVDAHYAFSKALAVSDPFLHARRRLFVCHKRGVRRVFSVLDQQAQDIVALAVGNYHLNAFISHLAGNVTFGRHAAASEAALLLLYIFAKVATRLHLCDELRLRVCGTARVDAVDVA